MSPELQNFFDEIGAWVDAGCPKHDRFLKEMGLCANLASYRGAVYSDSGVVHEFYELLEREFGETQFPFGGRQVYMTEENHYANTERLAWINKHRSRPGESGVDT